jgi:PAS domain S-box-containing protein
MTNSLEENTGYLASAINEIEDYAIILIDLKGYILNWNKGAQNIKGYAPEEIIGKNFRQFYTETDRRQDKPWKLIEMAIEKGRAHDEGWRVRKDGSLFWASVTITAVHDKDGNVVGFSKVTRDLSERRKADLEREKHEQQLSAQNKELEQFLYIASHDLQEPVRTVSNFTGLLIRKYEKNFDAEGKKLLEFIHQGSLRMIDLIKGLLDYSRIGRNKKLSIIDCNLVVELVKNDLSTAIEEANVDITADKLPIVKGYETEMRLLFQNQVSNALKFRKPDVPLKVHISARNQDKFWEFSVKDNGIGIDPKFNGKIFQIFQRLHLQNEYEGSGIGLAHCSKIAELHGGKIWVDSAPGEGATFYFTISKI